MEAYESFLSFHSLLSAQAACCNWTTDEEHSVVRDLFTGRIRDADTQSTLIRKKPRSRRHLKTSVRAGKKSISIYRVLENSAAL